MLHLYGNSAYTAFQISKIQTSAGLRDLHCAEVFFLHTQGDLHAVDTERLQSLLQTTHAPLDREPDLIVIPRIGTISPWSSKATEIIHVCNIDKVERIERGVALWTSAGRTDALVAAVCDPMTETVINNMSDAVQLFHSAEPKPVERRTLGDDPEGALEQANQELGLALSPDEIAYLAENYGDLGRDPTDVELLMFSQANSEHCRHKIFNASWTIDGQDMPHSLFQMIRNTHAKSPKGVLTAYADNSAVLEGYKAGRFFPDAAHTYRTTQEDVHIAIKVETHNHPTGISPHPGAGTGSGGEIRDEGATGRGGKPKAGLAGFSVSDLQIPDHPMPWEDGRPHPSRLATPLQIMIEGPIGAAAFNNEFGRPNLCGYFRTFHQEVPGATGKERRGYHKPIMIAGGYGNIRPEHVEKKQLAEGALLIALGGPAMLIGLGGGSASSMATGAQSEDLDFASVQRANPEMQRRCQEVIDRCWALGLNNPIESIHDVGAGGLSNAFPELVHDSDKGGVFNLRDIPNAEPQLSPMEIWCSEAQERYVLGILPQSLPIFASMCVRENAPFAVVGRTTNNDELILRDAHFDDAPIDMPLSMLLGKTPQMHRVDEHISANRKPLSTAIDINEAAERVLRLPTVGGKSFLITIGDRSITGMVARDQMVGPWQVPVADVAVTTANYDTLHGEAMAMGERTPLALLDSAASGRMAIGEAITNIAAADIPNIGDIKMSANWMVAAGHPGEGALLYDTVHAIAMELCPSLGIAIPVGKDSMSMRAKWQADGQEEQVTSPLSLVVTAFAPVHDARKTLTPELRTDQGDSELWLIDLGHGENRLGGSALAYVFDELGSTPPNLDHAASLKNFFTAIQSLQKAGLLLAYHDRSDGGLWASLCEMAFAGRTGITADVGELDTDPIRALFAEELGAVLQIRTADRAAVQSIIDANNLQGITHKIGTLTANNQVEIQAHEKRLIQRDLLELFAHWTENSHHIQRLRDNPYCADQERETNLNPNHSGLSASLTFDPNNTMKVFRDRPKVAILREQGVNGQIEMAAAFDRAGFEAVDVHMNDLRNGAVQLADFKGLVACGGFSYGDVLGAGGGWAKPILFSDTLRDEFQRFFHRPDTFSLGVCNGCQMMSQLKELIPGAAHWPRFVRNESAQFEARLAQVEIVESPSILLAGMSGSIIPIPVAHGEGRTEFAEASHAEEAIAAMRYVSSNGQATEHYPANPNGSASGHTAFTSRDGRATIMMPHPERAFRSVQFSWHPDNWGEDGPWMRLFRNARQWVG